MAGGSVCPQRAAALVCKENLRATGAASRVSRKVTSSLRRALFDLPTPILEDILRKEGLRSREVCRALAQLQPLHRLTPYGLHQSHDLVSALSPARHSQLQALDLRPAAELVTDRTLATLCQGLPRLQHLNLGGAYKLTSDRLAAAVACLPSLTALHLTMCDRVALTAPLTARLGQLAQLRELALPKSICDELDPAEALSPLGACSQLSRLSLHAPGCDVDVATVARCVERLPALAALCMDTWGLVGAAQRCLQGLGGLDLQAQVVGDGSDDNDGEGGGAITSAGQLLQAVGALTNLRSLRLGLERGPWAAAERGWLSRLSLLTSLDVRYRMLSDYEDPEGSPDHDERPRGAFNKVVSALPHLPRLHNLQLDARELAFRERPDVCAALAGAFAGLTALQRLDLDELKLAPGCGTRMF